MAQTLCRWKRRSYEDSALLRKFIWDGENILLQTDSGGTTNRDYTHNPQHYGELISQSNLFHHYDALGSTDRLTDSNEDVDTSYLYKAFGEQTILTGSNPNRFTWIGKLGYYRQPDTSDYWVRARVYRPQIGRWVRRDPAEQGAGSYGYVRANPVRGNDPSGLFVAIPAGILGEAPLQCAKRVKGELDKRYSGQGITGDKWRHCVYSCRITQECHADTAYMVAVGKEIIDFLNPFGGTAEKADLEADGVGIGIGQACPDSPESCEEQCSDHYSKR